LIDLRKKFSALVAVSGYGQSHRVQLHEFEENNQLTQ